METLSTSRQKVTEGQKNEMTRIVSTLAQSAINELCGSDYDIVKSRMQEIIESSGFSEELRKKIFSLIYKNVRSWKQHEDMIFFSVVSDGTSGRDWISRLEHVSEEAKNILLSSEFIATKGKQYNVVVLDTTQFGYKDLITKRIVAEANRRNFFMAEAEAACLTRIKYSDEEIVKMGLKRIHFMHSPIRYLGDSGPRVLNVGRHCDSNESLSVTPIHPIYRWVKTDGLAFLLPPGGILKSDRNFW